MLITFKYLKIALCFEHVLELQEDKNFYIHVNLHQIAREMKLIQRHAKGQSKRSIFPVMNHLPFLSNYLVLG